MKVKLSFFRTLLMLMMLMAFSPISRAACIPAPDPDLNNDGIVNSADLVIVTRSNGVAKGNPRYNLNLLADTNCDGKINPTDIHYVNKAFGQTFPIGPTTNIEMIKMSSGGQFKIDNLESITSAIHFMSSSTNKPFTVSVTQTIKPEYGLILKPLLDGNKYTFSKSTIEKVEQSVSATMPGSYEITTTSTIVETGQSASNIIKFKVLPAGIPDLSIPPPTVELESSMLGKPVVLKPNSITKVAFGMNSVQGNDGDKVIGMTVIEPKRNIRVELNDTGLGTDSTANDRVYGSEFININSTGMNSGECMSFYTIVHTTMGDVNSSTNELCVSALGLGSYQYVKEDWLQEGELRFARNTIDVEIRKGTPDARIQQIAASIDCTVVSGDPRFGEFVFKLNQIPAAKDAMNVIMQKSKQLMLLPEVVIAGPTISAQISSIYSNDPLFNQGKKSTETGDIPATSQARADEAWMVVRGNAGIAVLDTGVMANHQDLNGKVLAGGYNFAEDNDDTNDTMHHGSHVAGIAAAQSNNGVGISAVSWNSKILPIKLYKKSDSQDAPPDVMAKAIRHAANNKYIKIINFSVGFPIPEASWTCLSYLLNAPLFISDVAINGTIPTACQNDWNEIQKALKGSKAVCKAVAYAVSQNKIFVAAAGNKNKDVVDFPAACSGAVAVGAVEPTNLFADPTRWVFLTGVYGSHYGGRVDLAAAGSEVLSTVPPQTCMDLSNFLFPCVDTANGYRHISGTSQAAPMVAGAAAVVLAKHPLFTPDQVIDRLKKSAKGLSSEQLGAGALDVFEAVFNGNFELIDLDGKLVEWQNHPNISSICSSKTDLLGLFPVSIGLSPVAQENNKRMLVCDNTSVQYDGIMNELDIPEGVTELPISFDWRMVSEDLYADGTVKTTLVTYCDYYYYDCYYVMSPRNDRALVRLYNLQTKEVTTVFVDRVSNLINYGPLVSASNGWKGNNWQTFSVTVPVTAGKYQLQVQVINGGWNSTGDAITLEGTTLFMMDRVRFRNP